jgi:hypothetical protein
LRSSGVKEAALQAFDFIDATARNNDIDTI